MRTFRCIDVDCFNRIAKNAFFVVVTFIFVFENCQNSFSCRPFFGPFWSVKYLDFGQKLPIRTAHYTFLESRQAEVTKIHIMFCPPRGPRKGISWWTTGDVSLASYNHIETTILWCLLGKLIERYLWHGRIYFLVVLLINKNSFSLRKLLNIFVNKLLIEEMWKVWIRVKS